MPRNVKCQITGEIGTVDTFVKIGGKYYKSQEVYDEMQRDKECKKRAIEIILHDFLHYEVGRPYPTLSNKKYSELCAFYSNEIILKTIEKIHDNLEKCCAGKEFASEYNSLCYIFAAINSHIGDIYNAQKKKEKRAKYIKKEQESMQMETDILNDSTKPTHAPTYKDTRNLTGILGGDIL